MTLTHEDFLNGARLSLENSKELIDEGKLLFNNDKFSRAFTLFQLSIEETGKSTLIFESVISKKLESYEQQKKLLKQITNHKLKTKISQKIDFILALVFEKPELKKVLIYNAMKQSRAVDKINDYKNFSLYVSNVEGIFKKPSEMIPKSLAEDFMFYAEIRNLAAVQLQRAIVEDSELLKTLDDVNFEEIIENPPLEIKELLELIENN